MSKPIQRSFAAGEIAEELFARVDLAKRQTGLALCKNFWVLPHGPAQNCPGSKYVLDVKDSTNKVRLRGFAFSDTQTMALEFGAGWIRFHTAGGTVLEAAKNITGITQANPGVVTSNAHGFVNGQTIFQTGIGGMTQLNGRFVKVAGVAANTYQLQDLNGTNINTTGYAAYTAGGTAARVYEIATTYAATDLFDLHFTQKADVMTIVHPSYAPAELKRLGATNWTLTDINFNPAIATPVSSMWTFGYPPTMGVQASQGVGSGAASDLQEYKVTAISPTLEESYAVRAFGNHALTGLPSPNPLTVTAITNANPGVFSTGIAHSIVVDDPIQIVGATGMAQVNGVFYRVGSVPSGTTFTLKDEATAVPLDTSAFGVYNASSGSVVVIGVKNNLLTAGNYNKINMAVPTFPATAIRFNVYKRISGVWGFIGQFAPGSYLKDNNIAPDTGRTPPEVNDLFSTADNKPGAVGYYEGRRVFGGTNNNPLRLVLTQSGTESNLTFSIPTKDNDVIQLDILSAEAARIRHVVPLDVLVLLTALGVWKVAPVNSDILTPSSSKPKLLTGGGANNVPPLLSGAAALFPAAQGGRVRELKYKADANFIAAYQATDISVMAPHLFDGFTIVDAAYAETPNRMAFFVRSDGVLLGLTYLPEHDVAAWWQRTTDGLYESVAAVLEGNETVLYCIVNRQGARKVEIFSTRRFATLADSFFVDSGVTYSGAPITTISSGLWHLEGKTVSILADGAVHAQKVVTNGSITLDQAASKVQIGLPIVADLTTMPIAVEGAPAFGMANLKNINRAWLRVKDTSSIKVGPDFNTLRTPKQRTNEPMGSPPALKSGIIDVTLDGKWVDDGAFCVRQDQPLPVTITSIALGVADGG